MLNLCVAPALRRKGLARRLLALAERAVSEGWGDSELYLHVEDEQEAANTLYEALNYVPQKYRYDAEFPYTKAEAKVLRNVTYRRKTLPPPSPGAPCFLPDPEEAEEGLVETDAEEEEDEEEAEADDGEDYSWVKQLIK